ncbi:TetR/AcrR family transcriptional regulator [Paenibacillus pinihumi]|uniref:TetR/AcrR family transcriptional regulator n=1 Tax=Paenibacillus pinihumi TaxID=669462 RepID=UPI000400A1B0|nr:TetR/AcrR family transcriptional regulator [Paenibacillus pinihumi]
MARNKYPEQTLEMILQVSARLFTENGFDKTSLQDIINELGMSKGAIYHHFSSKEDILAAVMEQQFNHAARVLDNLIKRSKAANAREKLVYILEVLIVDDELHSMDKVLVTQIKNPQFVVTGIQESVNRNAPTIAQLIIDGTKDGSLTTEFPAECAEVFMLLVNIWINPFLFNRTRESTVSRLRFLQHMMRTLGVDIVNDSLIQKIADRHSDTGAYNKNG